MKFLIDKEDLLSNIQHLSHVVPTKNTMPILTNYLIEANEMENIVKITTTDLKITVIVTFNATVMEAGTIAITAKELNEIVAVLPNQQISFATENDLLKIHCQNIDFTLNLSEYSNFPLIPEAKFDNAINFKANEFIKMINKTIVAVSREQHQSVFSGILWEITSNKQTMVATDSKKIAQMSIETSPIELKDSEDQKTEMIKIVLPTGGINFLQKIINEEGNVLKAEIGQNRVIFQYRNFIIFSHLINSKFPDYTKVFPESLPNELLLDKNQLRQAIKRISLLAPTDSFKILFNIKGSSLELSTSNDEKGGATECINGIKYTGDDINIAFNFKFLTSILDCIDTENVKICLGDPKKPALFYNEKDADGELLRYLLMPLRISRN